MVPWLIAWWVSAASTLLSQAGTPRDLGLEESVEVSGRLPAVEHAPATSPSRILEGDALRAEGARSLPEALARDVAFEVADQVGNGRQLSLELRGFSPESGATGLFIDGVRLNEPDTNQPPWWLVRLEDVERVEIDAGPRGSFLGGGSMAGAVHVMLRRPREARAIEAVASAGSFGLREASVVGESPIGSWRLIATGAAMTQDGFRDGAALRESSARVGVERELRRGTLGFTWAHLDGRWRQPGALTKDELEEDPSLSASNELDFQDAVQDLLIARREHAGRRSDWSGVASFRRRTGTTLTTGRSGYGFRTDDSVQSLAAVLEARTRLSTRPRWQLALRWGVEASRDRLHPEGFATDDVRDGVISSLEPSSAVDVDWDRAGAFAHLALSLPKGWELEAGLRHDLSRVTRAGVERSAGSGRLEPVADAASFGDTTARLAVGRRHELRSAVLAWRASWEESFLAPSATQLFAYPGFLSNPDLEPQRGGGPSLGLSFSSERFDVVLDAYEIGVDGEIAFEEGAAPHYLSRNVNAGTSRRRGVELRLAWRPRDGLSLHAAHAAVDARFLSGFPAGTHVAAGARIPLVPDWRTSLAIDLGPWGGLSATLGLTRSGASALSADLDGSSPLLPGRDVVHVVVRADLPRPRGLALRLCADNLLDDGTPVRGVEHFDQPYYTPAPPRAVTLTLSFRHP